MLSESNAVKVEEDSPPPVNNHVDIVVNEQAAEATKKDVEKESATNSAAQSTDPAKPKVDLRFSLAIILSAAIGIGVGVALSDGRGDPTLVSWVKLPGDLFLRGLRCVVLPMVFVQIFLAIVEMVQAGRASSIGFKTVLLYSFTTVLASCEGLLVVVSFKKFFNDRTDGPADATPEIFLQCPTEADDVTERFLTVNGTDVVCGEGSGSSAVFELIDINSVFEKVSTSSVDDSISFSETLQDGIFKKMVPENIMEDFVNSNFIGVIMFSIVMAVGSQYIDESPDLLMKVLVQTNKILLKMVDWLILTTPIGVFSLIAGNMGEQSNLSEDFENIGFLVLSTLTSMSFHFFVVYPSMLAYFAQINPWSYFKYLIPAQSVGFATGSSAATLPASLKSVESSGQVPDALKNFVLSVGATLNMDGGAIYFPTTIVFLAVSEGLNDELGVAKYLLIVLLSTLGSAGTAPVPSASLVLIITAYNTAFNEAGTPASFGLIFAIDWLMDRFRVVLNVTGDMTMARIVTAIAERDAAKAARNAEQDA